MCDALEREYSAGVFVYSYRRGKRLFLFLKRKGNDRPDVPKGHIERGESAMEAAIRETREESGLDVRPDAYFKRRLSYWFYAGKERRRKTVTFFVAEVAPDAKIKVSWEHSGYKWMSLEEYAHSPRYRDTEQLFGDAEKYIGRKEAMERLNGEYKKLPSEVDGWELSRNFVAGEGPLDAEAVLVGQAPGRFEDESGRPFIGMSGQLLTRLLHKAGLRRERVYITSVVQFFPPKNRVPSDREIALCRKFLYGQLDIIKPKLVVVVGAVALGELLGAGGIMKVHGTLVKKDRKYFVTLHPAAAVRIKSNMPLIENDFRKLKSVLAGL